MMKRGGFIIKWSWHDKGTIPAECVVFHNLLGFFGNKEQSVELLIMKVLFSFTVSLSYCRKQKLPLVNFLLRN
jgi:hypothetical protein